MIYSMKNTMEFTRDAKCSLPVLKLLKHEICGCTLRRLGCVPYVIFNEFTQISSLKSSTLAFPAIYYQYCVPRTERAWLTLRPLLYEYKPDVNACHVQYG